MKHPKASQHRPKDFEMSSPHTAVNLPIERDDYRVRRMTPQCEFFSFSRDRN
jgi:hypothetical protein